MQPLALRRMLQATNPMQVGKRLVPLSISSTRPASFTNWFSFSIRSASTSSESSTEERTHVFVVWAPDYTDKGALARRLAVRELHLHQTKPGQETGFYCELFVVMGFLRLTLFSIRRRFSYSRVDCCTRRPPKNGRIVTTRQSKVY